MAEVIVQKPKTLELYFDGIKEVCTLTDDPKAHLDEHLYVAEDGRFIKFPEEYEQGDSFMKAVKRHNEANGEIPELAPED
jgi:hypothetical protein